MRGPSLLSWMEQRHVSLGRRVRPCDRGSFEAVTAQTGQSQVRCFSRAASRFGDDMLDGKRVRMKAREAPAILTLPLRPLRHRPETSAIGT